MAQGAAQLSGSSMKVRSDQGVFFFAVPCCAVDGLLIWFKAGDAKAFCLCFHGSIMAAAVVAFKQRRDDEYKKEQAVYLFFFLATEFCACQLDFCGNSLTERPSTSKRCVLIQLTNFGKSMR